MSISCYFLPYLIVCHVVEKYVKWNFTTVRFDKVVNVLLIRIFCCVFFCYLMIFCKSVELILMLKNHFTQQLWKTCLRTSSDVKFETFSVYHCVHISFVPKSHFFAPDVVHSCWKTFLTFQHQKLQGNLFWFEIWRSQWQPFKRLW